MASHSLNIGLKPDYELKFGEIRIPHAVIVSAAVKGCAEADRLVQHFSLAGLKNSVDEIVRGRTVYGALRPGGRNFAICEVPEKYIVITVCLKFGDLIPPVLTDKLKDLYQSVFFENLVKQPKDK